MLEEFEVFAKECMNMIYRVAYSWTKDSDDANDVTQEVLIQLFKTKKEFESDSHIKNWKSGIRYKSKRICSAGRV